MIKKHAARCSSLMRPPESGRLLFLCCLAALLSVAGCQKSPAERCIEESLDHLRQADVMLREHQPSIEKLSIAVVNYRSKHKADFRRLRRDGETLFRQMPAADRDKLSADAKRTALAIVASIKAAAALYPDQRQAMRLVRPLMVHATPKGLRYGANPPWLPKLPEPNAGQGAHEPHHHGGNGLPPSRLLRGAHLPGRATPTHTP